MIAGIDLYQAFPEVKNACESNLLGILFMMSTYLMQRCNPKRTQVRDSDKIRNVTKVVN